MALDAARGLAYLHRKRIAWLDCKSSNVLLTKCAQALFHHRTHPSGTLQQDLALIASCVHAPHCGARLHLLYMSHGGVADLSEEGS